MRPAAFSILFGCILALPVWPLHAQPPAETKAVLQLMPPDAVAWGTLKVKDLLADESMRMMPLEVFSAMGKTQLGVDPLTIERVDAITGVPGPLGIQAGGLVTFLESVPHSLLEQLDKVDEAQSKGLVLYEYPGAPDIVIHVLGQRQVLIGTQAWVMRAAKTKPGDGPLRALASGLGEPGIFQLVLAVEPLRDLLESLTQAPPLRQNPQLATDVNAMVLKSDMIAMRLTLGKTPGLAWMIQTKSPSDANEVAAAASRLVKLGMQSFIQSVEQQASDQSGQLPKSTLAYLKRMAPEMEKQSTLKTNGNRLTLNLDQQQIIAAQVGIATGLLLPAVQSARESARRFQSMNNLKQILLAGHNFESANKTWPGDKPRGTPPDQPAKLSWRVHILPYIEQNALYQQFHLDEPWDSEHNIKLLDQMPKTYEHPSVKLKKGYTLYQMPTGQNLIGQTQNPVRFASVTDGLSNTIAIIETSAAAAKPWTKPEDVNPLEDLTVFHISNGNFIIGIADGSVRTLPATVREEILKAMLTINGGETVDRP